MPTARPRRPHLVAMALFLGGTLLGLRPLPKPTTLGRAEPWPAARPARRARFLALPRSRPAATARAIEPDGSRGRRPDGSSRRLAGTGPDPRPAPGRAAPVACARPPGSTRLRC